MTTIFSAAFTRLSSMVTHAVTCIAGGLGYHWLAWVHRSAPSADSTVYSRDVDRASPWTVAAMAAAALIGQNLQAEGMPTFDEVVEAAEALDDGDPFHWLSYGIRGDADYTSGRASDKGGLRTLTVVADLAREAGPPAARAMTLQALALSLRSAGDVEAAARTLDEGVTVSRSSNDVVALSRTLDSRAPPFTRRSMHDWTGAIQDHESVLLRPGTSPTRPARSTASRRWGSWLTSAARTTSVALVTNPPSRSPAGGSRRLASWICWRTRAWMAFVAGEVGLGEGPSRGVSSLFDGMADWWPETSHSRPHFAPAGRRAASRATSGRCERLGRGSATLVRASDADLIQSSTIRQAVLASALDGLAAVACENGDAKLAGHLLAAAPEARRMTEMGPSWLGHRRSIEDAVGAATGGRQDEWLRSGRESDVAGLLSAVEATITGSPRQLSESWA